MLNYMVKVITVGPVSYVGGINVHMRRLSLILGDCISFDFFDDSPPNFSGKHGKSIRKISSVPGFLSSMKRAKIVHIHSGNWLLRILLVLVSRLFRAKVVVTLHSYRIAGLKKFVSDAVLRLSSKVICVNTDIKASLGRADALVKEAFIPPFESERKCLPHDVEAFIEGHGGAVLLCANAYRLTRYQGKDLYGLDQCLAVARQCKKNEDKIVILFVVGTVMESDDLYSRAQKTIAEEGLDEFICIYPEGLDFISLMRRSHIVLRPTVTDGDALTIREALFLGKPVIASDVVTRPSGTVTYMSEDPRDLYMTIKKVASALSSEPNPTCQPDTSATEEYRKFYLEVYRQCIS